MKGLDAHELELLSSIARGEKRTFLPDWAPVSDRLISRGLIRMVGQSKDERYIYDWLAATPLGRLALTCDLAARGAT